MADAPSDGAGHRARLRQRLFEGGGAALLDHELVEYLLALAIPRRDTKAQAKALLEQFGGIGRLLETPHEALRREGPSDGVIAALKIVQATARRLHETRMAPARMSALARSTHSSEVMATAFPSRAKPPTRYASFARRMVRTALGAKPVSGADYLFALEDRYTAVVRATLTGDGLDFANGTAWTKI